MKKIFKIAFASLLAFSIAPALSLTFNQNKDVAEVQAEETWAAADEIKYQDGDTVKDFREVPDGYTYNKGVITVTSASTKDYSIWVNDNTGPLTIIFERDYGSEQIYLKTFVSRLNLISTDSVDVTLAFIKSDDLFVSGKINLSIVGNYALESSMTLRSLLEIGYFHLLDDASIECVDPIVYYYADANAQLVRINYYCEINTTGCFKVGFINDPLTSKNQTPYSIYLTMKIEDFHLIKCEGEFAIYNKDTLNRKDIGTYEDLKLEEFNTSTTIVDNKYRYTYVKPYKVSYDANGGTGVQEPYGGRKATIKLPTCTFTPPTGKKFKCWQRDGTSAEYNPGDDFYVNKDYTFFVTWEDAPDELTGTVAITGSLKYDETLTAVVANTNNTGTLSYQWRRNGEDIASATSSTYKVVVADIGYTLSVKVGSSVETGFIVGTASSQITKADGPDTPKGISSTDCTDEYNDNGVISGITTEMEYKLSTSSTWISGDGKDITELKPGTYEVRFKETETHEAGKIKNVVIKAYNQPVPPVPSSSGLSGGAIVGITIASVLVVEVAVFAIFWFVIKKKTWADFVALFKKK